MILYTLWHEGADGDVPWIIDAVDENCEFSPEYRKKREDVHVRELILDVSEKAVRGLFDTPAIKATVVKEDSVPATTCPSCDAPSSVTFTREEERFPYGIAPNTVELTAIVDKGRCSSCSFEFTDCRAEKARAGAVQAHIAATAKRRP